MIGVTGTNGKTTTTYLCKALLEGIGRRVGLIGTVAYQIGQETIPASHTTPGALDLQALLAKMVEGGLDHRSDGSVVPRARIRPDMRAASMTWRSSRT